MGIYSHSLGLTMALLFLASWLAQSVTGVVAYNEQQLGQLQAPISWSQYLLAPDFWNRTLQNWQSDSSGWCRWPCWPSSCVSAAHLSPSLSACRTTAPAAPADKGNGGSVAGEMIDLSGGGPRPPHGHPRQEQSPIS
ncbi:hypothetical protein GCM10023317_91370 [Actinopolymorpha pittospori]